MRNIEKPTLFLDRDGVINRKLDNAYVRNRSEFEWLPGAFEALGELQQYFYPVLVVTNQQGIGKKLMSEFDLQFLHEQVESELSQAYGRPVIHDFYYCPHLASAECMCRKPENGMFLQAKADYPFIQFERSWMVGDSPSDMQAAASLHMHTAFVGKTRQEADCVVNSLSGFLNFIRKDGLYSI